METKLKRVAGMLGPRNASILAKAMAIGTSTIPQVLYPLHFYSFLRKQHAELSAILIRPLRSAKMVGSRIHKSVLTNLLLGGFMANVHAMVQSVKARLFKGTMSKGGATRRAIECLCFRLLRDNDTQPDRSLLSSIEEIKASNFAETPRTIHSQGWWAESLLETAELNNTHLISKGAPAGGHQYLLS
jgi:hypothetical protein